MRNLCVDLFGNTTTGHGHQRLDRRQGEGLLMREHEEWLT